MRNTNRMRLGMTVLSLLCAGFLSGCSQSAGVSQASGESTVPAEVTSAPRSADSAAEPTAALSDPAPVQSEVIPDQEDTIPEHNEPPAAPGAALKIVDLKAYVTYSCNDGAYYYTFDSVVPQFEFHNASYSEQEQKLNQYFQERQEHSNDANISSEFADYKEIDRSLIESQLSEHPDINTWTTQSYTVQQINDQYCSVVLECYLYGGGAHGTGWSEGYCMDLQTGDVLSLSDLFGDTDSFRQYAADYFYNAYSAEYSSLSGWSQEALYEIFSPEAGANWYIKDNALFVEYGDYALGSYADGHQLLSIPLEDCRDYGTDRFMTLFGTP